MRKIFIGLMLLLVCACASPTKRQIDTYTYTVFVYDMTARTLARVCTLYDVPKETCDRWGQELEAIRATLRATGDYYLYRLTNDIPPECSEEYLACETETCREQVLMDCYFRQAQKLSFSLSEAINKLRALMQEAKRYERTDK